jgi:hypothetical protein
MSGDIPKPLAMLASHAVKQIPEDTIDDTLNGIANFLAAAFTKIEAILEEPQDVIELESETQRLTA